MVHISLIPAINATIALLLVTLLSLKYKNTKDKISLFWTLGFISYFIYSVLIITLHYVSTELAKPLFFTAQTLISLFFLLTYLGIIRNVSTKKFINIYLPIIFFTIQEIIIIYFDFYKNQIISANQIHIIFFDIPFNLIIAILFYQFYKISRKSYSKNIALGWLGYTILAPLYFYFNIEYLDYISVIPNLILLLGFFQFYRAKTKQSLLDIEPEVESNLKTKRKHKLDHEVYLAPQKTNEKAYEAFVDAVTHNVKGLCITRYNPCHLEVKYSLDKITKIWITRQQEGDTLDPHEIEQILESIKVFIKKSNKQKEKENIILIDATAYLISNNSFNKILKFIEFIKDTSTDKNNTTIIHLNKDILTEQEYNLLKKELKLFK